MTPDRDRRLAAARAIASAGRLRTSELALRLGLSRNAARNVIGCLRRRGYITSSGHCQQIEAVYTLAVPLEAIEEAEQPRRAFSDGALVAAWPMPVAFSPVPGVARTHRVAGEWA